MARRALGPATLAVVRALGDALGSGDRSLLVACSGGADSLALAVGAAHVARRRGLPLSAVVVDHGLQAGSADTAERAQQQLVSLGIAGTVIRQVSVADHVTAGPEAAARRARYAALEDEACLSDATVLLGHTLDDQAETVLLGLARGSGPRSLAGMATRSGRYLRPMLSLRRETTERACAESGLMPWRDPHNSDDAYARARVRSRVLPVLEAELGPGVAEALSRTAGLARDDSDLLDALAAEAQPVGEELDCAVLASLPAALRSRVIRVWLTAHGVREASFVHVSGVEELITRWHGQSGVDVPGLRVRRLDGRLVCAG